MGKADRRSDRSNRSGIEDGGDHKAALTLTDARTAVMNMMTNIHPQNDHDPKYRFLDEEGRPSDRSGPDLTKARPIDEVIKALAGLRTSGAYPRAFYQVARDSGIHLSVDFTRDDGERLLMGMPCDSQQELRTERYNALRDHVTAKPARRDAVIDFLNSVGHFIDNRPYPSIEEAVAEYLAVGGRIYVLPSGECEEIIPWNDHVLEDGCRGHRVRRMTMRYKNTLRRKGAREALADFVREHGTFHEGSGAFVLEAGEILK